MTSLRNGRLYSGSIGVLVIMLVFFWSLFSYESGLTRRYGVTLLCFEITNVFSCETWQNNGFFLALLALRLFKDFK